MLWVTEETLMPRQDRPCIVLKGSEGCHTDPMRTWEPNPMIALDTMKWSLEYRLDIRGDRDLHLRAPLEPRARA
jgi:hypothetical protein